MKKLITLAMLACCTCSYAGKNSLPNIIPAPKSIEMSSGSFNVKGAFVNYDQSLEKRTVDAVARLADELYVATGRVSSVASAAGIDASTPLKQLKGIYFITDSSLPAEAYDIEIGKRAVKVTASDHNGFIYALSSIRQMLPVELNAGKTVSGVNWKLPCCVIKDSPRFGYRGLMLDSSRHFWSVAEVKRFLAIMSVYKLNRLHWHLTDDQGWRVEIHKYPRLTDIGAFRAQTALPYSPEFDGKRYGGYYTREEIKDIVAYAETLGITIVPEIDLPGHMVAALASYPELGCTGGPYEVRTQWGISKDVLCPGKESTFEFLEGVLDELCELFPGEYIHIGGDECPKTKWESCPDCQARIAALGLKSDNNGTKEQRLQNYVTKRIQDHLATKGRKIIGWDEILEGDLAPGATVMSWRGTKGGIKASAKGFDVVMSPNTYCYFDYYQSDKWDEEPIGIARGRKTLPLGKVYGYEPFEGFEAGAEKHILGVQANLWTEYVAENDHLEYMLLPRLLALSEVQWCPEGSKDYEGFLAKVAAYHIPLLDILGYNYRPLSFPNERGLSNSNLKN